MEKRKKVSKGKDTLEERERSSEETGEEEEEMRRDHQSRG